MDSKVAGQITRLSSSWNKTTIHIKYEENLKISRNQIIYYHQEYLFYSYPLSINISLPMFLLFSSITTVPFFWSVLLMSFLSSAGLSSSLANILSTPSMEVKVSWGFPNGVLRRFSTQYWADSQVAQNHSMASLLSTCHKTQIKVHQC